MQHGTWTIGKARYSVTKHGVARTFGTAGEAMAWLTKPSFGMRCLATVDGWCHRSRLPEWSWRWICDHYDRKVLG